MTAYRVYIVREQRGYQIVHAESSEAAEEKFLADIEHSIQRLEQFETDEWEVEYFKTRAD